MNLLSSGNQWLRCVGEFHNKGAWSELDVRLAESVKNALPHALSQLLALDQDVTAWQ